MPAMQSAITACDSPSLFKLYQDYRCDNIYVGIAARDNIHGVQDVLPRLQCNQQLRQVLARTEMLMVHQAWCDSPKIVQVMPRLLM